MSKTPHRGFACARVALLALCASALLFAPAASAATLTIDIVGSAGATGTVVDGTGAGDGTGRNIDCSGPPPTGKCSAAFSQQAVQLTLTATPGPSSVFAGWSGLEFMAIPEDNCYALTNPCMLWLSVDRELTATFAHGDEPICVIEPWECPEFGRYIVVFWDWVEDPVALAHEQVEKYGGTLGFIYQHALKGYSAGYPTNVVDEVESEPTVKSVEEDVFMECAFEPWLCEEEGPEPEPEPTGPESTPTGHGNLSLAASPTDAGSADTYLKRSRTSNFNRCGKGKVHRRGWCGRGRALARRACRKRTGAARHQCIRRRMHKLRGIEKRRVHTALRAGR